MVRNPPANAGDERCEFPRVERIPWRRALQLTPVFLPGESHGQRSLAGYSPWGRKESDMTEVTKHACMHARHSQDYWGLAGIRAFLILVYFPSIWISIIYLGNPSPFQTELGFLHRCWKCRMVSFWVNSQWVSRWIRFSSQICHYSKGCSGHRFHFTTVKVVVATDLTATSCFQKHQGLLQSNALPLSYTSPSGTADLTAVSVEYVLRSHFPASRANFTRC